MNIRGIILSHIALYCKKVLSYLIFYLTETYSCGFSKSNIKYYIFLDHDINVESIYIHIRKYSKYVQF